MRLHATRDCTTSPNESLSATDLTYIVEWSDTLKSAEWSTTGVSAPTPISNDGTRQKLKVTLPARLGLTQRFVHLRITRP